MMFMFFFSQARTSRERTSTGADSMNSVSSLLLYNCTEGSVHSVFGSYECLRSTLEKHASVMIGMSLFLQSH